MTESGKQVYERLKAECLPTIHKLSLDEKYQIMRDNAITTNLPRSFWPKTKNYYANAEWDAKYECDYTSTARHYVMLRDCDTNINRVEYFSVLYRGDEIFAEAGYYDIRDFRTQVSDALSLAEERGVPVASYAEIIEHAYHLKYINVEHYKREPVTYGLRNPAELSETLVSPEELKIMANAFNISDKEIEPPAKAKQGVYER